MASGRASRNNVLAGIFVIGAIALGALIIVILSNIQERLRPHTSYIVRFTIVEGADGLGEGAPVKLGGQRIGRVVSAKFIDNPVSGDPEFIDVEISVSSKIRLYSDADVQLIKPLLGSGSSINIASFTGFPHAEEGEYTGPPKVLAAGDMIHGRQGAPGFLSQNDYAKFQNILARVDRISADVEPRVAAIMDDAQSAVGNVRTITDDARGRWTDWGPKVDAIVSRAEKTSERFQPLAQSVEDAVDAVKARVKDAQEIFARATAIIDENRKSIDEIVQNVRDLSAKAKGEGYDKVMAVLDEARTAVESAGAAARRADDLLARNSGELDEIIANAGLAANQLKLATVEIRSAPWRLLYQPTKKEMENELLYNSVRQYSESVTELRRAAEQLRVASEKGAPNVGELSAKLKKAFDQYQEQERAFLNRWVEAR